MRWRGRAKHSRRLAGLVLVDVGPEIRSDGVRKIAAFTSEATPLDSVDAVRRAGAHVQPAPQPRAPAAKPAAQSAAHARRALHLEVRPRHRGQGSIPTRARRRELLWSAVDAVECPTLVVRGAQSDVFHDEDAERLAGRLRRGRWVKIEGAGHTVQGDNPADLLVELRAFLTEVAPEG